MINIGINEYLVEPSCESVFESGFFSDDKKYQVVSVHGLFGPERPSSLDEMGDGLLYIMNRGLIFICMDNPKKGTFDWRHATTATAYVAGGLVGVVAKGVAEIAYSVATADKKFKKAIEHPLTFCLPYTAIESIELVKFGGVFGKLKDIVLELRTSSRDSPGQRYWVQAKNSDETWADLVCTMKFIDEARHFVSDYIGTKTGSREYADSLVEQAIAERGEENLESATEDIKNMVTAFIERRMTELELTDEKLEREMRDLLRRYKSYVSRDMYSAAID